jgi:hypothetical protein
MSTWTLTYTPVGGPSVTQDFAAWGLKSLHRKLASFACDTVTFIGDGLLIDANPLFVYGSTVTIKKNGIGWFTGVVTQIPGGATPKHEQQSYEVSGPWWYFENLIFQQEWYSWDGIHSRLISTLKTMVIIGQNLDGTKMDLGQMMSTVLDYILVTAAASMPPFVPFAKGLMTPDVIIPFGEVTDKTCAQVIESCIQWVPDAVSWFDYTTTPPTFNVARRGDLGAVTIPAYGAPTSGLEITPRHDLVVPAVIAKYDQTNTIDGTTYNEVIVDQYPPNAPDPAFSNLVQHIDLIGGNATFQKQAVTVKDRPKSAASAITMPWILKREPWLTGANAAQPVYDVANIGCANLFTTIDPHDPEATSPDPGFTLDSMTEELIAGTICDWMKTNDHVYGCKALIQADLQYTGSDPATAALFTFDPANPLTPTPPGVGFLTRYYGVTVTNAATQTYEELTSLQASEPVPVGLAQKLYQGLSVLHYQGTIETTEQECGGTVGLNHVVNLSGGRAEWATMLAAVFEINENIDEGITQIRIGANVVLNLEEWTELLRAARGRLFSWHLQQRTTGKSTSPTTVQGPASVPQGAVNNSAPAAQIKPFPFQVTTRQDPGNPGNYQFKVYLNSSLLKSPSLADNIAITGLDIWTSLIPNSNIWVEANVAGLAVSSTPTILIGAGFNPNDFAWNSGAFVEDDGGNPPHQTKFRVLIATSGAAGSGAPPITQWVRNHLVIQNITLNFEPAIYPSPLS